MRKKSMFVVTWKLNVIKFVKSSPFVMGNVLSHEDAFRLGITVATWCLVIQDISKRWGMERDASEANLSAWMSQLAKVDQDLVISDLKGLLAVLREWTPHNGATGIRAFKQFCAQTGVDLRCAAYRPYLGLVYKYVRSYNHKLFQDLNIILQYVTRLTLQDLQFLEEKQKVEYLEFEEELKAQQYPDDVIAGMRDIAEEWFGDFELISDPCHSSGATAELKRGSGREARWKETYLPKWFRYNFPSFDHPLIKRIDVGQSEVRSAKVQFVPKAMNKKRVISMEPVSNLFVQNMIAESMKSHFKKHPEMNIDLNDQTKNRSLCQRGSANLAYGTIDLSSASDSVTKTLVDKVFGGTMLGHLLLMSRTPNATFDDKDHPEITLEKFAPMGSSLCFPVECAIFSVVIAYAQRCAGVDTYYRVYGDDMICHRLVFNKVVETLEALHFKVNKEKSFAPGSTFTESCGAETLDGFDVAPIRISRRFDPVAALKRNDKGVRINAESFGGLVENVNSLYFEGLYKARSFLLRLLLEVNPRAPFGKPDGYVKTLNCYPNSHLKTRWNKCLQRVEVKVMLPSSTTKRGTDEYRYQTYLEQSETRERKLEWYFCDGYCYITEEPELPTAVGAAQIGYKHVWVPYENE